MGKGDYLGEFEHIMLLAVLRLRGNAYGMTVRREIQERIGRDVSIGAVYATLDRLCDKGYVSSRLGDPTPERGGRAKRYFTVEASGETAIHQSRFILDRMWDGLQPAE